MVIIVFFLFIPFELTHITCTCVVSVPPKVRELEYKIINKSSVCIKWKTPVFNSGKLSKFVVLYTSDLNWPLDKWHHLNVSVFQKKNRVSLLNYDYYHI